MKLKFFLWSIFPILFLVLCCNQTSARKDQPQSNARLEKSDSLNVILENFNSEINKAMFDGDYQKLLKFYCDDVVIKAANRPALTGIAAIKQSYEDQKKQGIKLISFNPVVERIWRSGNEIFEYGSYAMAMRYKDDSAPAAYSGSYFLILELQKAKELRIKYMLTNLDFMPHH